MICRQDIYSLDICNPFDRNHKKLILFMQVVRLYFANSLSNNWTQLIIAVKSCLKQKRVSMDGSTQNSISWLSSFYAYRLQFSPDTPNYSFSRV